MKLTRKVSGIIAGGGAMALVAGAIAYSGGVGASFSDDATADVNIKTGTINCGFVEGVPGVAYDNWEDNGVWASASVDLDDIQNSTGSDSRVLTLINTGSMAVNVTWDVKVSGNLTWDYNDGGQVSALPKLGKATLLSGHSEDIAVGFNWSNLTNNHLGKSAVATYTAHCVDGPQFGAHGLHNEGLWLFDNDGEHNGSASWDPVTKSVTLVSTSEVGSAAGIRTLVASGGALPSNPPVFKATTDGNPYLQWAIYFNSDDVSSLLPYVISYKTDGTWLTNYRLGGAAPTTYHPGSGSGWASLLQYVANANWHFAQASLTQNGGTGGTSTVTCVNYTGTALFGTC